MASKSPLSIRAAISVCLSRCLNSDAPLCCLAGCLEDLETVGWPADDTRCVELAVLDELKAVKQSTLVHPELQ